MRQSKSTFFSQIIMRHIMSKKKGKTHHNKDAPSFRRSKL